MGHTNDRSTKASSFVNPTSLNLQPRPFAPLESDEKDEAVSRKSGYSENFLEKIINTPRSESAPIQRKSGNRLKAIAAERMAIQAKLAIGEPNDKYEQEADATAARVVQQINSSTPSQSQPIQRQELEEEELQMKPIVQRRENIDGGEASTDLESSIQSARGSGQSLDANLQESMGQAMGADFSGVKVHTDSQSDQLNKSIQAKAFTTGQDLFFRQGAYEPSSRGGQELIAHELTHVVQQNGGAVQRSTEKPAARLGKSETHPLQDASSEKKDSEDIIQRLKWSEVHTGQTEVVGIADKQMPEGVEAVTGENETQDRNVWAGQTKKGRSGFLWHKESTLEIQYDIKSMKQYKIIDPTTVFYTAVRNSALGLIKQYGINPNFGNAEKPDGATEYNVRGFNYFGKDTKIPKLYGSYLEPEPWTILSFNLPEGTLIERDPEIPNGLRTTYYIQPSDIT